MRRSKDFSRIISIITGLASAMLIGTVYADEANSCTTICAADLKACRKQADIATSYEAHPAILDAYRNGRGAPSIMNNEQTDLRNTEIEKRKAERYQLCATANNSCLHQCSPEQTPTKASVVLKRNN